MTRTLALSIAILLLSSLSSCGPWTKEQFLHQYDQFMTEVEDHYQEFHQGDWEKRNQWLNDFLEDEYPRFEEELSLEEKGELWGRVLAYHVYQYREQALVFWKENEETYMRMLEENTEALEDLGVIFEEEITPEIERMIPRLEEMGNELLERLEDRGVLDRVEERLEKLQENLEKRKNDSEH